MFWKDSITLLVSQLVLNVHFGATSCEIRQSGEKLGSIVRIRCFSQFRTNQALTKQDSVARVPLAVIRGRGLMRLA